MTPVENLSPTNFLSVCDVAMDILEELQVSAKNVITIPLLRTVIRPGFNILIPGGDVNSGSQYCNYRLKAIEYLKENNYIKDFEPSGDNFIFNRRVEITVDREVFNKFYDKLEKAYQKRVVGPAQKEQIEELNERQKAFKEVGRQISPRVQKNFDVKQYIEKVEIIGRDKVEQHGNKNTAKIKNIAGNHPGKKWFSMDNPIIWFIGTIIVVVVSLILNQLFR